VASIAETYRKYPGIGTLLPAMGYGPKQIKDLETTISRTKCDVVVIGTPIDLRRVLKIDKPMVRVTYDLQEIGKPTIEDALQPILSKSKARKK
jgi:predicted GTPase